MGLTEFIELDPMISKRRAELPNLKFVGKNCDEYRENTYQSKYIVFKTP